MNPSSQVSAWVGSFPTPRTNHQYHLAPPIFRVVVIWFFPVVSFSNRASVGSLFNCSVPPLPFHRSPSPSLCYIVPWFFEPSWPGTGPFQPSIRPFHRLLPDHVEIASFPCRVSVWVGLFHSPSVPPLPSAPLYRSANCAPSTPGVDFGGLDRPPLLPHAPLLLHGPHLWRRPPPRTIPGHHQLIFRLKTFVGSISAKETAADSLASSGNGAVDTGAPLGSAFRPPFVLSIAHHWRLRFRPS